MIGRGTRANIEQAALLNGAMSHTLDFDDVMNNQREVVYTYRNDTIDSDEPRKLVYEVIEEAVPAKVKEFLTTGVTPSVGPLPIDLVILKFAIGPIALDVSLLSLVGVLIAYLIARSLF